jgi:pilus assembly protein Flp/PilA
MGVPVPFEEEGIMVSAKRLRDHAGQGLAEYALILALIAIAAVFSLLFMSGAIQDVLSTIGNQL